MPGSPSSKVLALSLLLLLLTAGMAANTSGAEETSILVYSDVFDDYKEKEYTGSNGPGL